MENVIHTSNSTIFSLVDKSYSMNKKIEFKRNTFPPGMASPLPVPCRSCMQGKRWHLFIPQKYVFSLKRQKANAEKIYFLQVLIREWVDLTNTAPGNSLFYSLP